jgi:hypothetical protein
MNMTKYMNMDMTMDMEIDMEMEMETDKYMGRTKVWTLTNGSKYFKAN